LSLEARRLTFCLLAWRLAAGGAGDARSAKPEFEGERALAGGLEARGAVGLVQTYDCLRRAQPLRYAIGEELPEQLVAVRPDALGLHRAPLRRGQGPGQRVSGQVIADRRAFARLVQPRMRGDPLVLVEDAHAGVGGAQPRGLPDPPIRHRIQGVAVLDVSVGLDNDLDPLRELRRHVRQRLQQSPLDVGESRQRLPILTRLRA